MNEQGAGRRPVRVHRTFDGPRGAPIMVLSNSLGTSLEMWDPQIPMLTRNFRVLRYDMRGHGRSPVPPGPYALADLGLDLLALLDDEGIGRAHLCGLSLGGLTSLWAAAHAPMRFLSVAVLSAGARFSNPNGYRDRAASVRNNGLEEVSRAVVGRWLTPSFAAANPAVAEGLRAMILATPPEGYASCCEAVAGADVGPQLASVKAPVLCIAAANDPAVSVSEAADLARSIPQGRLAVVQSVAHLQNVEQPQEVARLVAAHAAIAENSRAALSQEEAR
jgi:3-oxoadipate enol-lactonase